MLLLELEGCQLFYFIQGYDPEVTEAKINKDTFRTSQRGVLLPLLDYYRADSALPLL